MQKQIWCDETFLINKDEKCLLPDGVSVEWNLIQFQCLFPAAAAARFILQEKKKKKFILSKKLRKKNIFLPKKRKLKALKTFFNYWFDLNKHYKLRPPGETVSIKQTSRIFCSAVTELN